MPRPTLYLSIPQPCHERWDAMTPTGTGRHCAACDKVVTDFTRMTDGELVTWFQRHAGERTCGRVTAAQLSRELLPAPLPAPAWQRWALAGLALVGISLPAVAQKQKAAAQTEQRHREPQWPAVPKVEQPPVILTEPGGGTFTGEVAPADTNQAVINGIVRDKLTQEPISGVTVMLKDQAGKLLAIAQTDKAGRYQLPAVESNHLPGGRVEFVLFRYQKHIVEGVHGSGVRVVNVMLQEEMMLRGELMTVGALVVTRPSLPRRVWWRTKAIVTWPFRRHRAEEE